MIARRTLLFAFLLAPVLGVVSPACDDEDDCPAGHEGCVCAENYECLEGLQCLSEYCVAPVGETNGGSGSNEGGNGNGNGDGTDNVSACQAFIDSAECAELPGGTAIIDCSIYAETVCDISDYFNCLADNTTCVDGFADTSQWMGCFELLDQDQGCE